MNATKNLEVLILADELEVSHRYTELPNDALQEKFDTFNTLDCTALAVADQSCLQTVLRRLIFEASARHVRGQTEVNDLEELYRMA